MEPPRDRGRRDRRAAHLAGRRHARVGLGRLDKHRREGVLARQRPREDDGGDVCGHGTACAGIIRSLAPGADLHSVRVLGAANTGSGSALLAGLRYAIEQRFDVINMSLSTTKKQFAAVLHELADEAYFGRVGFARAERSELVFHRGKARAGVARAGRGRAGFFA